MNQKTYLKNHKKLSVWFDQISEKEDQDFVSKVIYRFCELLKEATKEDTKEISCFIDELSAYLSGNSASVSLDQDFFEDVLHELSVYGFDFYKFLTEISLTSFEVKQAPVLYQSLCRLAELTKKDELIFLCAWMSFNLNHYSACLLWLKKIKKQTAQTIILTGQIFLEMGEAEKALDYFEDAVSMDSSDTMGWFFLSKAAFCLDLYDKAWDALMSCHKKSPDHPEVAIFCTILAKKSQNKSWAQTSWKLLLPFLGNTPFSMETAAHLMELALILEDKKKLEEIIFHVPWPAIKHRPEQIKAIASLLKDLGQAGYYDTVQIILNQLI